MIDGIAADVHGNLYGIMPLANVPGISPLSAVNPKTGSIISSTDQADQFDFPYQPGVRPGAAGSQERLRGQQWDFFPRTARKQHRELVASASAYQERRFGKLRSSDSDVSVRFIAESRTRALTPFDCPCAAARQEVSLAKAESFPGFDFSFLYHP